MIVASANVRTMGIHPVGSGFGWAVCEGPLKLVEAGLVVAVRENTRGKCVTEFKALLERFEPVEVIVEEFDAPNSRRSKRAKALGLKLIEVAADRNRLVIPIPRTAVREALGGSHTTRDEIAQAVARHFPTLAPRLPKERRPWDGQARRMALFIATAAVLAHYQNEATALLNDVSSAA